ncbi:MAG: MBL fold metallo-hydrolase [Bacillota bacterium]|nr:MBL fold metallo-hydrolase [Bacillota bacterium]
MRLTDNIYFSRLDFDINMPDGSKNSRMTYAVLLKYRDICLVDSGVMPTINDLLKMFKEAEVEAGDINYLINTHCHFDHSGGNALLKELNPHLQLMSHPAGQEFIESPEAQNSVRPVPSYRDLVKDGVKVDRLLAEGDLIDIGTPLEIIYTPGHSRDSISVYLPKEKLVIVGDAIPLSGDLPIYEDLNALKESLNKIGKLDYRYMLTAFQGLYDRNEDPDGKNNPIDQALGYLDVIDKHVKSITDDDPSLSVNEITGKLVSELNLPPKFPPFVYTSVAEHVKNLK